MSTHSVTTMRRRCRRCRNPLWVIVTGTSRRPTYVCMSCPEKGAKS